MYLPMDLPTTRVSKGSSVYISFEDINLPNDMGGLPKLFLRLFVKTLLADLPCRLVVLAQTQEEENDYFSAEVCQYQ